MKYQIMKVLSKKKKIKTYYKSNGKPITKKLNYNIYIYI